MLVVETTKCSHHLHAACFDANQDPAGYLNRFHTSNGNQLMSDAESDYTFLTPGEAAKLLMLSPVTLRQYAQNKHIHAETTPGGHRRYRLNELFNFARQNGISLDFLEHYVRTNDVAITSQDHTGTRILIADDDIHLTIYLTELLASQKQDFITEIAIDGFEVGQKIEKFYPHVLLLDIMMPGIDGFSVCERLREKTDAYNLHIIAMTGYYTEENIEKILRAGADHCLAKPFDTEKLISAINACQIIRNQTTVLSTGVDA